MMQALEERGQGYLFKLKHTKNVKRLVERLFHQSGPTSTVMCERRRNVLW
jgi:hypothetical protein